MKRLITVWSVLDAYSRGQITKAAAMRALHLKHGEEEILRTAMAEAGHAPPTAIIPAETGERIRNASDMTFDLSLNDARRGACIQPGSPQGCVSPEGEGDDPGRDKGR